MRPAILGAIAGGSGGAALDPDVSAWLVRVAAASGSVSAPTQSAVNTFVLAAKANGYWSTFRRLNLFCGDQAASLVPLVNAFGGATDTNVGTTYAESTGPVTNGTSQYINTGLIPSEATGGISVYLRTTVVSDATPRTPMACRNSGLTQIFRLFANSSANGTSTAGAVNGTWGGVVDSFNLQAATTGGMTAGLWHLSRTSSTASALYKNGSLVGASLNPTTPATAVVPLYIFCSNSNGTAAAFLASGSSIGGYAVDSGMDAAQAGNYRTDLQAFQSALSRAV